jgi:hypothetical protein
MKKAIVAMLALAVAVPAVFGLDIKDGRIRLVIDEKSGRFAVYYLENAIKNKYVPLLYDQETRTTYATLQIDQKMYKLGDSQEFRVALVKEASGGVRIEYRSSICVVKQTFSFVTSPGASSTDSIAIRFTIENVSGKDLDIGLRYLLDTWLGEKQNAHFMTEAAGLASTELALAGDYNDTWIRSPGEAAAASGSDPTVFQVALGGPATRPERVVAANWKRLNDAAWLLDVNASRNFTLLPYSINDSAIALFYEPLTVRPGAERVVELLIGAATDGFKSPASGEGKAAVLPRIAPVPSATAPLDEMTDLVAVRSVLEAINAALSAEGTLGKESLEELQSTLDRLEARKGKY